MTPSECVSKKKKIRGKVLQEAWISFQKSFQSRKLAAKSGYDRVVGAHDLFSRAIHFEFARHTLNVVV